MRKLWIMLLPAVTILALASCGGGEEKPAEEPKETDGKTEILDANAHMHETDFDSLVALFEQPERDEWQAPQRLINGLGNLDGKVIADIGAGTGYFTFKLADVDIVEKVIATDIDQGFIDYLENRKKDEKSSDKVEIRKVAENESGLAEGEVDIILMVNLYHHLQNRVEYMKNLQAALKPGGTVYVLDWKKYGRIPYGPGAKYKPTPEEAKAELEEAGFRIVKISEEDSFQWQWLIKAAL